MRFNFIAVAHLHIDRADLPALIALQPALEANYRDVIRTTYPWTDPS